MHHIYKHQINLIRSTVTIYFLYKFDKSKRNLTYDKNKIKMIFVINKSCQLEIN